MYPVTRWIKKHGRSNIRITVLEDCAEETLDARERFWIGQFRGQKADMLNLSDGGRGVTRELSTEERLRISESLKKYYAKNENPFKGRKHTAESKARMSLSATGRTLSVEARRKVSESSRGRKKSPETLQKMSLINSGERNPMATITEETALEIWRLLTESDSKTPIADVSKTLGVPRHTVSNIRYGNAWSKVTGAVKK